MPLPRRGLLRGAGDIAGRAGRPPGGGVELAQPDSIAGLELWLDAQDASTITTSVGKVTQWDDKSGLDNHVGQGTDADRPTESTVGGVNGISFNDSSDLLELLNAGITGLDGPDITIFAVYSKEFDEVGDGWGGIVGRVTPSSWTNGWKLGCTTSAATDLAMHVNAYTTNKAATSVGIASGADAWKCAQGIFDSAVPRLELFIDGTSKARKDAGVMTTSGLNLTVGSSDTGANLGWVGDVGEVLIYNSILSAADIATVEAYLADRWGLTFAEPPLELGDYSAENSGVITVTSFSLQGIWVPDEGDYIVASLATGSAGSIRKHALSPAWDLSSLNLTADSSFSVGQPSAGVFLKPDGLKMYVCRYTTDDIAQYTLSPAFDISSASLDGSKSVAADGSDIPFGLHFSADGTKMYVADPTDRDVYEYTLTTPWDITGTVTFEGIFDTGQSITGNAISSDGLRLLRTRGSGTNSIRQYDMSPAFDITTCVDTAVFINTTFSAESIHLADNDDRIIVVAGNGTVAQYKR